MYEGYLELGGNEIINSPRSYGYLNSGDCPTNWIVCPPCEGLADALGDGPYTYDNIQGAPWYDDKDPASARFFGAHAISIENLSDSTRTAAIAEGIADGGVIGQVRHAVRQIRVRALLSARGEDALEYGLSWLSSALDPDSCGQHGNACGASDACFFVACPPGANDFTADPDAYEMELDYLQRHLHNVTCISGPLIEQKIVRSEMFGYIVEFTLAAGTPFVYSTTKEVTLQPSLPVVVQDVPFNLVPYPSAELASGTVVVASNIVTNPSFETNTTGWSAGGDAPVSTSGTIVGSRDTGIFAVGTASFRSRFTATATSAGGTIYALGTFPIPAGVGRRMSLNLWMFATVASGTAVLGDRLATIQWLNASNAVVGTVTLGPAAVAGGVLTSKSQAVPDTATQVRVTPYVVPTSWNSGAIIDLYIDAVAVTIP